MTQLFEVEGHPTVPTATAPTIPAKLVDDFLARVRTPMGLPIGARTHEEIAVAVAAELVSFRRLGGPPGAAPGAPPAAPLDPACGPR